MCLETQLSQKDCDYTHLHGDRQELHSLTFNLFNNV
jgi:hypothetical protein